MAFRISGQGDAFDQVIAGAPANATLDAIDAVVDWAAVRAIFAPAYDKSGQGQLGIDPIILFKMLLLEQLYSLSDVRVASEAADRLSFRRFLGLSAGDPAPDDTTLVRFRARLREGKLLDKARREVDRQLAEKKLSIRPGAIKVVDATVIAAATRPPKSDPPTPATPADQAPQAPAAAGTGDATPTSRSIDSSSGPAPAPATAIPSRYIDSEATFGGKKGKLKYGYKLHAAIDAQTGMIGGFAVTPANVADTTVFARLLDGTEAVVLADKGYDSAENRRALAAKGTVDGIMRRVRKAAEGTLAAMMGELDTRRNRLLARHRSPSEGAFCALKRWRRCGRAVYTGLAKVTEQITLGVLAHNLLKATTPREKCAQ